MTGVLVGEEVWSVVDARCRQTIDVLVEVEFKPRVYKDIRSSDTTTFRVVGHRHPESGDDHRYITNLPPPDKAVLTGAAIGTVPMSLGGGIALL